jgi:type IV pilus assembly protein PilB
MSSYGFVGDLLIRNGVVDAAAVARAIDAQAKSGATLPRSLADLGLADESAITASIASALHLECFNDDTARVGVEAVALLPKEFCQKRRVMPLGLEGNRLRLAVIDPSDYSVVQDVEFRTGKKTTAVAVTQTWFEKMMHRVYPDSAPAVVETTYDMLSLARPEGEVEAQHDEELDAIDPTELAKDTKLPPIVRLVNLILSDAAKAGASDVHIEPQESIVQVRQRVDGLLREVLTIPLHLKDHTISRLKIISGMDISERRKPQDGRSRLRFEGSRIDLRVSSLPTQFGEKIVIRLLKADTTALQMDQLGFTPANLQALQSFLSRPQGMILVTGPTGSGKTTTLYTALNTIKSPTNNIITLEDPIEFQIPGVNQTQINPRAGVTFAAGLRSILRQDPNVILVGEIRDRETADIALEASQTGHLLLSTLHTNDAPATITRLFDLGVHPFLIASSLVGIVAQRLVRRPCPACAGPHVPSAELMARLDSRAVPADAHWVAGAGCEECAGAGYKGRVSIHEVLTVTDEVRDLISSRGSEQAIRKAARKAGMRTLMEDGIARAALGLTTIEEVLRIAPHVEAAEGSESAMAATGPAVSTGPTLPTVPTAPTAPTVPTGAYDYAESADARSASDRRRVLVVEDSPTIVSVVKYFLELEGFEVVVAEDGSAGLAMALATRPDVIVSDLNMPGMDGLAMVKALRQDPRTSDVRVLMLTSESSVESEANVLDAGADDYVVKPVEPRRLAARVKALLGRSTRAA